MWSMYGHMGWMWLWSLPAVVLLAVLFWAVTRGVGAGSARRHEDSPETVLKRRYARGELDDQEYDRKLNQLRK